MQMALDDCGTVQREYKRQRHSAKLRGSRQDKAAVTVAFWDDAPPAAAAAAFMEANFSFVLSY